MAVLKGIATGKEEIDISRMGTILKQNILKINEKVTTPTHPIINYTIIVINVGGVQPPLFLCVFVYWRFSFWKQCS